MAVCMESLDIFQSTFPRGERPKWFNRTSKILYFNPRSRVGNDLGFFLPSSKFCLFQSTFPRGERQLCTIFIIVHCEFQSTFPRGERRSLHFLLRTRTRDFNPRSRVGNDSCDREGYLWIINFNPRSRVGNDQTLCQLESGISISIHVPAWGTTVKYSCGSWSPPISIHVPAWGTTKWQTFKAQLSAISIHVPAWGTTGLMLRTSSGKVYFNPRSRVGNDNSSGIRDESEVHFNPRSRVGNDAHPGRNRCAA